jgi:hypothetical protein
LLRFFCSDTRLNIAGMTHSHAVQPIPPERPYMKGVWRNEPRAQARSSKHHDDRIRGASRCI